MTRTNFANLTKFFYVLLFLTIQIVYFTSIFKIANENESHYSISTSNLKKQHFSSLRYQNALNTSNYNENIENMLKTLLPDPLPLVSVIIPCYNKGELIIETIISLLEQDYANFEMLIINDGSTDEKTIRTLDLINKTQKEFEGNAPIFIYTKQNGGLSSARNFGMKYVNASSEFIIFLDNDDLLHPNAISLMVLCILHNPQAAYCYPDQMIFGVISVWWQTQEYNSYDLLWENHPSVCSIFRKNVIESVQYATDLKKGMEDYNLWLTLSSLGYRGVRLPLPVFEYRTSPDSMSRNITQVYHDEIVANLVNRHLPVLYNVNAVDIAKRKWRPFLSIIISACHTSDYFLKTIYSLDDQSFRDFEVIIIGYCEHSSFHLNYLLNRYSFLRFIQSPFDSYNEYKIRNFAASEARGDYLMFLESGNVLLKTTLEKLSLFALMQSNLNKKYKLENCVILSSSYQENEPKKTQVSGSTIIQWDNVPTLRLNPFIISTIWFRSYGNYYDKRYNTFEIEDLNFISKVINSNCNYYTLTDKLWETPPIQFTPGMNLTTHTQPNNYNLDVIMYQEEDEKIKVDLVEEIIRYYHQSFLDNIKYTVNTGHFRRQNTLSPFIPNHWTLSNDWDQNIGHQPHILYLMPFMDVGGSEAVDLIILEALIESDFYVILLTELPHTHPWRDRFESIVSEILQVEQLMPFVSSDCELNFDNRMKLMDYLVVSRNIDVIFNRNTYIGYEYFQFKTLFNSIYSYPKHVYYCDLVHLYVTPHGAWDRVSSEYYEYLDRQFVISDDLKQFTVQKYKIPSDKFTIIYNGIDSKAWSPDVIPKGTLRNQMLNLPEEAVVIGLVARLVEQKDPLRWLQIAISLAKKNSKYYFVMIGDGDLHNIIENQIKNEMLENRIFMLGLRNDIETLMIDFDILLMTSLYEGVPIVMLEAMSLGIPIVSTHVGGVKECIINDGVHGAILPLSSSNDDFVRAIEKMRSPESLHRFKSKILRNNIEKKFEVKDMKAAYVKNISKLVKLSRKEYSRRYTDYILQKIDRESSLYLDC